MTIMNTINDTFLNALLADATYVNNLTSNSDLSIRLSTRMTPTIAAYIDQNFDLVTQFETSEFTGSGFDVTVWRRNTGKLYVSMRGTEPGVDLAIADLDLALSGKARFQLVDMVNWWFRETGEPNQPVRQISVTLAPSPIPPLFVSLVFSEAPPALGTGRITVADLVAGIEVNGHSLGGYLATAFTRLFGAQAHVQHTSTFNSAGFAPGSESVFQQLQGLIGVGYGLGRFPNASEQSNYFAQHGINLTTNSLWFSQQGQRVELFNEESATQVPNHFMYKLTDALALTNAISKLDLSLTLARANSLFEAGSNVVAGSLEGVLDGLRRLLVNPGLGALAIGDVSDSAPSRVAYHQALKTLTESSAFQSLAGKVTISPVIRDLGVQARARVDFQTIVALETLSPFVINPVGPDGQTALDALWQSSAWSNTYQAWLADKASLQAGAQAANLTDQYLTDRAAMLDALILRNLQNVQDEVAGGTGMKPVQYQDVRSGIQFQIGLNNPLGDKPQIRFGGDAADALDGKSLADHLYGGAGTDTLNGLGGADWLEGNADNDTLDGGAGDEVSPGTLVHKSPANESNWRVSA